MKGGESSPSWPYVEKTLRILAWTSIESVYPSFLPFTVPHDQISPYTHSHSHAYYIYMYIHVHANTCEKFEFMA